MADLHDNPPELPIVVEFAPDLALAAESARLKEAAIRAISDSFTALLTTLGVPGVPLVRLAGPDAGFPEDRPFRLLINGQHCPYPLQMLTLPRRYAGISDDADADSEGVTAWLVRSCAAADESGDGSGRFAEFLGLAAVQIATRQPVVLLGAAQVAAYRIALVNADRATNAIPAPDRLHSILRRLLELRLSIADTRAIGDQIDTSVARETPDGDIAEILISGLKTDAVEILLPAAYLRQLTSGHFDGEREKFNGIRDDLFYELGVGYPSFKFTAADNLKPGCFAFRVNHLTTAPRIGRRPDAEPGDSLGWIAESLAEELKETAFCFIDFPAVEGFMKGLRNAFPSTVDAAAARRSTFQITRVLRELVKEQISIRNLRLILESLIDYDYVVCDSAKYIIFDDRLPAPTVPDRAWLDDPVNLTSFVRTGLKRYISAKYSRDHGTLTVLLLSPAVEAALQQWAGTKDNQIAEMILVTLRSELDSLVTGVSPSILTTIEVRSLMRELIALEFPDVPVLAYQELEGSVNIQPLARVDIEEIDEPKLRSSSR